MQNPRFDLSVSTSNHLKHVIQLNPKQTKKKLAWTNTEASDDADHAADTDVAHK